MLPDMSAIMTLREMEEAQEEGCYDYFDLTPDSYLPGETIKYNKYSQMTILGDELYDFKGFIDNTSKDLSMCCQ